MHCVSYQICENRTSLLYEISFQLLGYQNFTSLFVTVIWTGITAIICSVHTMELLNTNSHM
jgi:hypothetical protein